MIAGIGLTGSLQGLYPQYSPHAVSPVKKLEHELPGERPEEIKASQTARKMAARAYEKYQDTESGGAEGVKATYSEDPYSQMRKTMEASLLTGQNIDFVA